MYIHVQTFTIYICFLPPSRIQRAQVFFLSSFCAIAFFLFAYNLSQSEILLIHFPHPGIYRLLSITLLLSFCIFYSSSIRQRRLRLSLTLYFFFCFFSSANSPLYTVQRTQTTTTTTTLFYNFLSLLHLLTQATRYSDQRASNLSLLFNFLSFLFSTFFGLPIDVASPPQASLDYRCGHTAWVCCFFFFFLHSC